MKLVNTNKNHLMVGNGMNDDFLSNQRLKNNTNKFLYQN